MKIKSEIKKLLNKQVFIDHLGQELDREEWASEEYFDGWDQSLTELLKILEENEK